MKKKRKILLPIPSYGFDPTEVSVPWKLLSENGFRVIFATPNGKRAEGDKIMLTGKRLRFFKGLLKAGKDAAYAYSSMIKSKEFRNPIKYDEIDENDYESIFLPGGHDKGVKEYLESTVLQNIIPLFFKKDKKVGAICHGIVLLARSIDKETGKSIINTYKTTALLKAQEILAYNLTRFWLKDYYLTYPGITVEEEVISVLKNKFQFVYGPKPVFRDSLNNTKHGFCVRDRNYLSGRWPGDIYSFTLSYIEMLNE